MQSLVSFSGLGHVLSTLWKQYRSSTSSEVKIVDTYVAFCVATGIALHTNVALVGYFPFNAYLGALFTCMGGAVLAVCLRMQLDTSNHDFKSLAPERAYADFILAHLVLLLVAWNYRFQATAASVT